MARRVVDRVFERRLAALVNSRERGLLSGGRRGLERETLRVTSAGRISPRPHPQALGSPLTNPHVTTDYSEALLELVTPTFADNGALARYLADLHHFVYAHMDDDEVMWAASMPGEIAGEADVPIARYGRSHRGHYKETYRRGLQTRYGGIMQAIAGAHYNYSFPSALWPVLAEAFEERAPGAAFNSARYFDLLRSYRRYGWLALYLFGVSPAISASFMQGRTDPELRTLVPGTLYMPHATTLRMSDLGYRNRNQAGVEVSVNAVDEYLRDLRHATHTLHPPYAALGVRVNGEYRQLNANVLQIDNEYYSSIRPKRVPQADETTSHALARGGVEYVEVRALDLCIFEPVGTCPDEMHVVEALLALCLLRDSEPIGSTEQAALERNHLAVARRGREPGLALERAGRSVPLPDWGAEILDGLQGICELLDAGNAKAPYQAALARQSDKLRDPELTPSARLLRELRDAGTGFADYTLAISAQHRARLRDPDHRDPLVQARFADEAAASREEQSAIESAQRGTFEEYLAGLAGPDIAS
jgi:glutamate--cysteine ligase